MIAKDIMTTEIVQCNENTNIRDIAKQMNETGVGSVVVLGDNNQNLKGIITDRDIVVRGIASDADINMIKSSDIMSSDVITATSNTDIEDVVDLMSDYQVKRIPIVDNNIVIGMISLGDMSQTYILEDEAGETLNEITDEVEQHY